PAAASPQQGSGVRRRGHRLGRHDQTLGHARRHRAGDPGGRRSDPGLEFCRPALAAGTAAREGRGKIGRAHLCTPVTPRSTLFPSTTLFRSRRHRAGDPGGRRSDPGLEFCRPALAAGTAAREGRAMTRLLRAPLFWVLLVAAGLRLAGLIWGLPSADGWDDDGFAPRNFLTALALTWKPGAFFTYPPLEELLPALPVAAWALAHAPSLSQHDVIAAITQLAYMTYFSVLGRLVSLAMSLG